jgi:phage tail sheath protein FI
MAGRVPIIGELPTPPSPISANTPTAVTAFIDFFNFGPAATPTPITSFVAFQQTFGGLDPRCEASYQIQQFFNTGGQQAIILRISAEPSTTAFASELKSALTNLTLPFNLLSIPATSNLSPADMHDVMLAADSFCTSKNTFYLADIPPSTIVANAAAMEAWFATTGLTASSHAAIYYPRLIVPDPLRQNSPREIGSSGAVAGIYADTDSTRGVWKAPAGTNAVIPGAIPAFSLNDLATQQLTSVAINPIRTFPIYGTVVWGARTTAGANDLDYQYVNVRRLTTYIEQSISSGLQWVVFQPNNSTLWASIRLVASNFLNRLWQQGALMGSQPQQAYFVKCDATTMTEIDILNGRVNILIGFAPIKPAEFVLLTICQRTATMR